MKLINKIAIVEFQKRHADSRKALNTWAEIVEDANWTTPAEIKKEFASASFLGENKIIFNIGGNKYRLVVVAVYSMRTLSVKWIGTHEKYNKMNF